MRRAHSRSTNCSDSVVTWETSPSTGSNLIVLVSVAGQLNTPSAASTISMSPPSIVAAWPLHGPATAINNPDLTTIASVAYASLVVANLPLLDASGVSFSVVFGMLPPIPLAPFVSTGQSLVDAVNSISNDDGSVNITFAVPPVAVGVGVPISVIVTRAGTVVSSSPSTAAAGAPVFTFADPVITGVALSLPSTSKYPCPLNSNAPYPWPTSCNAAALYLAVVSGYNFGPDPSTVTDGVDRVLTVTDSVTGVSATADSSGIGVSSTASALLWRVRWTDTQIVYLTTVEAATVSISLVSTAWAPESSPAAVQTATFTYTSNAFTETIAGISPGSNTGIPTTGGLATNPLVINASYPALTGTPATWSGAWAQILVAGAVCPLLGPTANTPTAISNYMASLVTTSASGFFTLKCVVPPGQGSNQPIQVRWFSSTAPTSPNATTAVDSNYFVTYAGPLLTMAEVRAPACCASSATGTYLFSQTLRLPTLPSSIRLHGSNLGRNTTVGTTRLRISIPGTTATVTLVGTACGAPYDPALQTCFDFGFQQPNPAIGTLAGIGPILNVEVIVAPGQSQVSQLTSLWPTAAYALPSVTSLVVPSGGLAAIGGKTLGIIGTDFSDGTSPVASGTISYVPPTTALGATGAATWTAPLSGCVTVNATYMSCKTPPGGGTGLTISVAVAGQSSVPVTLQGASTLAYEVPTITSAIVGNATTLAALNTTANSTSTAAYNALLSSTTVASLLRSAGGVGGGSLAFALSTPNSTSAYALARLASRPTTGGTLLIITGTGFGPAPPTAVPSPSPGASVAASATPTSSAAATRSATPSSSGHSPLPSSSPKSSASPSGATNVTSSTTSPLLLGNCVFLSWHFRAVAAGATGTTPSGSPTPTMSPTSSATKNGGVSSGSTSQASGAALPICNGVEDWVGEGELPASSLLFWSNTLIVIVVGEGAGVKDVVVGVRNARTPLAANVLGSGLLGAVAPPPVYQYAAPVLTSFVLPSPLPAIGDVNGGITLTLIGSNFGPSPAVSWDLGTSYSLTTAPSLPASVTFLRFNGGCFTNAFDSNGDRVQGLASVAASCEPGLGLISQNDTVITMVLPPGIGANLSLSVEVWTDPSTVSAPATSNTLKFSYTPPIITGYSSTPLLLTGNDVDLFILGTSFGNPNATGTWPELWNDQQNVLTLAFNGSVLDVVRSVGGTVAGVEELLCTVDAASIVGPRTVAINVAGQHYTAPAWVAPGSGFSPLYIACGPTYFGHIGENCVPCPMASGGGGASCAGWLGISGSVLTPATPVSTVLSTTKAYGGGAFGGGFASQWNATTSAAVEYDAENPGSHALVLLANMLYGRPINATNPDPLDVVNTYPVALPGFYSLATTCVTTFVSSGSSAGDVDQPCVVTDTSPACPATLVALFNGTRDTCLISCDPPEACLGANVCAPGYASLPPAYACRACAPTYYRTGGTCTACPSAGLAYARLIGFVLLVLAAGAVFFVLNSKGVALGSIAIGLDYIQVIAILNQTNIAWPTSVASLLRGMSAFNLNIEVVAPECVYPGMNADPTGSPWWPASAFEQKFAGVVLLPIAVAVLFVSLHFGSLAWKYFVLQRSGDRHRNLPALLSLLAVTAYVLYLDETRTLLEVYNCAATPIQKFSIGPYGPTATDSTKYLRSAGIACDKLTSDGTLWGYNRLVPIAAIGLVIYSIGYPAAILAMWWRNRELIMEDQLLRAKGVGDDRLTNPHAYKFRKSWSRSYLQFRPDYTFWVAMIVLRKLVLAAVQVIFNADPQYQMAASLFVLLCAYGIQVRIQPYMSPGEFDAVLLAHEEAARTSPIHARLRATLANIESRGRKRGRRNVMDADGHIVMTAAISEARAWLSNYNVFEATLLFAAVLVCLLGMVFDAANTVSNAAGTASGIGSLLLAVIVITLLYILLVCGGEAVLYLNEVLERRRAAAAVQRKKVAGLGTPDDGLAARRSLSRSGSMVNSKGALVKRSAMSGPGAIASEPVAEQGLNPLFALASLGAPVETTGDPIQDAKNLNNSLAGLLAAPIPPQPAVWNRVRELYTRVSMANDKTIDALLQTRAELATLKRDEGRMAATIDDGRPRRLQSGRMQEFKPVPAFSRNTSERR